MRIQTAGQQKYYDFIEERAKKLRTGMIVWGSLFAVAFIGMFSDVRVSVVLALIGAALAVRNTKAQKELKEKLDVVEDKEEFFRQLADPDLIEIPRCHLLILRDYVLAGIDGVSIYPFSEMEKVEIEAEGTAGMALLLTDRQGIRHEIVSCTKGEGMQKEFDKAYQVLGVRISAGS